MTVRSSSLARPSGWLCRLMNLNGELRRDIAQLCRAPAPGHRCARRGSEVASAQGPNCVAMAKISLLQFASGIWMPIHGASPTVTASVGPPPQNRAMSTI
jgi:hypothetical protein